MKKTARIQTKLLGFIIPMVLVAFVAIILISYFSSKNTIEEKTAKLLKSEGTTSANAIEAWANRNLGILDTAVDTMIKLNMTEPEILNYEGQYLETYSDFPNGIYISSDKGHVYDATGWEPDYNATESSWYKEGVTHEVMTFGEPYIDALTGGYIVTASRKIDSLDGNPAVAACDISLDILSEVVGEMEVEGNGDAFILDETSGVVLASHNAEIVGKSTGEIEDPFYSDILQTASSGEYRAGSYASNAGTYMVNMVKIKGTSWVIVVRALETEIYWDIRELGVVLATAGIIVIAAITIALIIIVRKIVIPIQELTDTIVAVTDGDFTKEVHVKGHDEVSVMAGSMKHFMETMRHTLGSIMHISSRIDVQAKGSNSISGELLDSASGQAEAMQQMRLNLEELVQSIGVIAENATTLAMVVSDTNEAGEEAIGNIEDTMKEAENGRTSMSSVTTSMNEMQLGMDTLEKSITDVGTAAEKINQITGTIRDIAEETNLLALNASIEAARAGDAGRGFAVVATQIKQLAETSGNAAGEISTLIDSVTELIHSTVQQSQQSVESIKESSEKVYAAADQFNNIYESIEGTSRIVNDMIAKVRQANDVASNMAAITEEQSASAEEIEATAINIQELADNVTQHSSNVKTGSTELADTASTLKEKISGFTIE